MRNAYSMAMKCNRIIDKSICCNANIISRRLASKTTPRSRTKEASPAEAETEKAAKRAASSSPDKINIKPLYLMNADIAKKIADVVIADRGSEDLHVMQMYPGLGLLTKELLEAGMKKIHMYEGIEYFWPGLIELQRQYPDRLQLHQMNFTCVLDMSFKDWKNGAGLLDAHFADVKKQPWSNRATFEVIGSMGTPNFLYRLVRSLLFQHRFRQWGRWILYLCVPPSVSLVRIFYIINPCRRRQNFLSQKLVYLLFLLPKPALELYQRKLRSLQVEHSCVSNFVPDPNT